jgi:hypothetical protein
MRVWLDDQAVRDPMDGWTVVRTADEAIALLATGNVKMISLDHDLGEIRYDPYPREITGMDVVNWMVVNKVFPKIINVHSFNVIRAKHMVKDLLAVTPPEVMVKMWRFDASTAKCLEALGNEE